MPSPTEIYLVEISTADSGMTLVAVTDRTSGRRLSGSTMSSAVQMVGVLIEDHRERAVAEPVEPYLSKQKRRRREEITAEARSKLEMGKAVGVVAGPECFPESALLRIREIADSHPDIEVETGGGLQMK